MFYERMETARCWKETENEMNSFSLPLNRGIIKKWGRFYGFIEEITWKTDNVFDVTKFINEPLNESTYEWVIVCRGVNEGKMKLYYE
jgi:hypothetical protein